MPRGVKKGMKVSRPEGELSEEEKTSSHRQTSSSCAGAAERFKLIFFFTAAVATSKWIKFNELEVERD